MKDILEELQAWGCDVKGALSRLIGDEKLYRELIGEFVLPLDIGKMERAVSTGNIRLAFDTAHQWKGTFGNLGITPLYEPVCALTEIFRKNSLQGAESLIALCREKMAELREIAQACDMYAPAL